MGILHTTLADELAAQLEHPNAAAVWSRAVEVFGEEAMARDWMNTARDIFGGRSPRELVETEDPAELRLVLKVLLRIDYGVFS
jgi:putative toxin-antitoxin system antitoxin component (TIGR02293 family)